MGTITHPGALPGCIHLPKHGRSSHCILQIGESQQHLSGRAGGQKQGDVAHVIRVRDEGELVLGAEWAGGAGAATWVLRKMWPCCESRVMASRGRHSETGNGCSQPRAGAAQICLMQDRQASPCMSQKLTKNLGVLISPPKTWPATTSSCYSPGKGMAVTALTALHLPPESCQQLIQP